MQEDYSGLVIHKGISAYFDRLYRIFEPVVQEICPHLPPEELYFEISAVAAILQFDPKGLFIRAELDKPDRLIAAILLYLSGAHYLIDTRQRQEFIVLYNYYKIKKATSGRYGIKLKPLFDYFSHLLKYGKKLFLNKPIRKNHLEAWKVIILDKSNSLLGLKDI